MIISRREHSVIVCSTVIQFFFAIFDIDTEHRRHLISVSQEHRPFICGPARGLPQRTTWLQAPSSPRRPPSLFSMEDDQPLKLMIPQHAGDSGGVTTSDEERMHESMMLALAPIEMIWWWQ